MWLGVAWVAKSLACSVWARHPSFTSDLFVKSGRLMVFFRADFLFYQDAFPTVKQNPKMLLYARTYLVTKFGGLNFSAIFCS
jgi:hypothetical protein